jgi:arylsulfatase A-like enzyme
MLILSKYSLYLISFLYYNVRCTLESPNVIIILIDDSGYDDIDEIHTPVINSIAKQGVSFSNAYVTAPQCSPSRVGLLTGRYQQHFGHESNSEFDVALARDDCRIIPEYLPYGYISAMIGKWNLGDIPNAPKRHGFNVSFLYRDCDEAFASGIPVAWNATLAVRNREYSTSMMFERGREFIGSSGNESPFFLYLAPMSPHVPHVFPPHYNSLFASLNTSLPKSRRKVLTMMQEIEDGVKGILSVLREKRLEENTLLFFINDNGAPNMASEAGTVPTNPNHPFRGYKGDTLEGGLHVRFHMQWPRGLKAGQTISTPVSSLDILATIADVMELTAPEQFRRVNARVSGAATTPSFSSISLNSHRKSSNVWKLDGISLLPLLQLKDDFAKIYQQRASQTGETARFCSRSNTAGGTDDISCNGDDRVLYWRFGMECKPLKRAIRHQAWKWVKYGSQAPELYNLTEDIHESHNLATTHADVAGYLAEMYEVWNGQFPPVSRKGKKTAMQCQQMNHPPQSSRKQSGAHV